MDKSIKHPHRVPKPSPLYYCMQHEDPILMCSSLQVQRARFQSVGHIEKFVCLFCKFQLILGLPTSYHLPSHVELKENTTSRKCQNTKKMENLQKPNYRPTCDFTRDLSRINIKRILEEK
jgi:hypothetical protein